MFSNVFFQEAEDNESTEAEKKDKEVKTEVWKQ